MNAVVENDISIEAGLEMLGYEAFLPGQREAIEILLDSGRLLLVAPTGGGKSLTYQLPATMLPGTTLVVSPLIALMHDQVRALEERGVSATYLAGTLDAGEMRDRLNQISQGTYKLVYVAPERLVFDGFRNTTIVPDDVQYVVVANGDIRRTSVSTVQVYAHAAAARTLSF